jgi:hypothetical protein
MPQAALCRVTRGYFIVSAALATGAGDPAPNFGAFTMGGIGTRGLWRRNPLSSR